MTNSANWMLLLPEEVRTELSRHMTLRNYQDGQYIYRAGESSHSLYQIKEGGVRLRVLSESGKEVTYIIYSPGDCFGFLSAIDSEPRPQDTIAVGEVTVASLSVSEFERLRNLYPAIDRALLRHTSWRIRELFKMYEFGNLCDLRRRLALQIGFLLDFGGKSDSGDSVQEIKLTQDTLASSVCATRQAISKVLKSWSDKGIIEYRYGRLRVLDRGQLAKISEQSSPEH
ncbi:Crp/Fnr family transcriptional regulator [Aestuariirhabdus litorea]|uniref:Crp/Fnr family transcriptional regulator n=1 Tax=Aestuariirhabdus litorea TaxID=2528527 RepID=A0A3P3VKW2_9GAMM|nr:Crp/Fnr family transcriptional regulator [Aestuariirhabdus litorea]RRJ82409.1 Crp/Fnr family transcriptional regulator [Aestuariirhabdus litorea]RWW92572.1 cyclic nucleotide-binding domain-containing protein [Endozoicomonadaceae bacterium GTF-13]